MSTLRQIFAVALLGFYVEMAVFLTLFVKLPEKPLPKFTPQEYVPSPDLYRNDCRNQDCCWWYGLNI